MYWADGMLGCKVKRNSAQVYYVKMLSGFFLYKDLLLSVILMKGTYCN